MFNASVRSAEERREGVTRGLAASYTRPPLSPNATLRSTVSRYPLCCACCARFIYGEAISALPMNGGAYNVLINTTSKPVASFAACLAVISYIATGVVSAATAISYLQVTSQLLW